MFISFLKLRNLQYFYFFIWFCRFFFSIFLFIDFSLENYMYNISSWKKLFHLKSGCRKDINFEFDLNLSKSSSVFFSHAIQDVMKVNRNVGN